MKGQVPFIEVLQKIVPVYGIPPGGKQLSRPIADRYHIAGKIRKTSVWMRLQR